MAGLVTKETNRDVQAFVTSLGNKSKQTDSQVLISIMKEATGNKPKIWGNDKVPDFLIGFGKYKYQRKNSKEEFEWFNVGFAPRKTKLTVYLTLDINAQQDLIHNLGKAKWGKGCLYINKLDDINIEVLKQLIARSNDTKWHKT